MPPTVTLQSLVATMPPRTARQLSLATLSGLLTRVESAGGRAGSQTAASGWSKVLQVTRLISMLQTLPCANPEPAGRLLVGGGY